MTSCDSKIKMKAKIMRTLILTLLSILITTCLLAQVDSDTSSLLIINGDKLGNIEAIDYNPIVNGFPRTIQNKMNDGEKISDSVLLFLKYAQNAKQKQNSYYAFRYSIKAIGAYYKNYEIEYYEVAAGLKLVPQQGISELNDTIGFKFKPLFNIGKPLSGGYKANFTVKNKNDSIIEKFQIEINEIKEYFIKFPVKLNEEGIYYVGYQLIPPAGKPFPEVLYTFLAIQNIQHIIFELKNIISQLDSQSSDIQSISVRETFEYFLKSFKVEQNSYQGFARNFPALGRMMFFWDNRDFKQNYMGKINYPYDIELIEKYISKIKNTKDNFHQIAGDNKQAVAIAENQYFHYRLYVPSKYQSGRKRPLIAIFPMGFEVDEFFNEQDYLKKKADTLNCFILCVGSMENGGDERDKQLFLAIDRIKRLYDIDSSKLFLTGGGNSGSLVWQMGLKYPDYFKAIAPIGGSALWLSKENVKRNEHLPILLVEGSKEIQDIYNDVIKTKDIAKILFNNFRYIEIEGEGHLSIWNAALPKILDYFSKYMKK
jgi:hypothetical protein